MQTGTHTTYVKRNWSDYPSTSTPVDAENLNAMDAKIYEHDESIEKIETVIAGRESIAIATIDWASSETYTGYYEATKSLTKEHTVNVEARIKPAGDIPTTTEESNFALIKYFLVNDDLDEATLLCSTVPSSTVNAWIVG